jgi:outer membrane immunogenic protein
VYLDSNNPGETDGEPRSRLALCPVPAQYVCEHGSYDHVIVIVNLLFEFLGDVLMKQSFKIALLGLLVAAPLGVAQAADMAVKAPPPVAEPAFSWAGGYLGINGGWARDTTSTSLISEVQPATSSWLAGGHGGVNFQSGWFVVGGEFDADYMRLNASAPCFNPAFSCNTSLRDQFSLRARAGVAIDRVLLYATGGGAFSSYNGNTTLIAPGTVFPASSSRAGWIAGVGAEYAVTRNIIVGLEYLHADFGQVTMTYDVSYGPVRVTDDVVRARLSYKFDWLPAPVVAKY